MLANLGQWGSIGSAILSIIVLLYTMVIHSRLSQLRKKYDFFMRGQDGQSIERKLLVEVTELREASKAMEMLFQQQSIIKKVQESTFQKVGFVKYNAFENIGNDLSFSLTILDGENNGLCISSVYGRNESRIFCKPILEGKSVVSLSQEELESLSEALSSKSNKESLISASMRKSS